MPYCAGCGAEISATAQTCPNCGRQQSPVAIPGARTDGQAIASLVLGIAGIVVCPLVCSIIAIVLGNQARARMAADPSLEGEGLARAGVILGWIGVGLGALGILFWIVMVVIGAGMGAFG